MGGKLKNFSFQVLSMALREETAPRVPNHGSQGRGLLPRVLEQALEKEVSFPEC
jgi:hypothetical protein